MSVDEKVDAPQPCADEAETAAKKTVHPDTEVQQKDAEKADVGFISYGIDFDWE